MYWQVIQACTIAATFLLTGGYFVYPEDTLAIFWNVLIPVLPLTFLFSPIIWRSVCPIASFNMMLNKAGKKILLSQKVLPRVGIVAVALLIVMVPARRFLFNENAVALAITTLAILLLALGLGFIFNAKAGFCNSICPVLPVEKLYGQHPILKLKNPRCPTCSHCTPKGCIDLAPQKSMRQAIGKSARSNSWLKTPFGVFAAAFPGFITGYFTTPDVGWQAAGATYLHIALFAALSYFIVAGIVVARNIRSAEVLPLLAAGSAGLYYWFAVPQIASALELPLVSVILLRSLVFAFIGFWLGRALFSMSLVRTAR